MNVVLSTDRLILRKVNLEDAAFIYKLVNDKGWLKYIGDRQVSNIREAQSYIQKSFIQHYESNGFGLYLVIKKEDGHKVGVCGLVNRAHLEDIDIGFAFLDKYCGKGYGFESASAVKAFAFKELKLERIAGITLETNLASIALLKKVGLSLEKKFIDQSGDELLYFVVSK